jgi:hypothetical protein
LNECSVLEKTEIIKGLKERTRCTQLPLMRLFTSALSFPRLPNWLSYLPDLAFVLFNLLFNELLVLVLAFLEDVVLREEVLEVHGRGRRGRVVQQGVDLGRREGVVLPKHDAQIEANETKRKGTPKRGKGGTGRGHDLLRTKTERMRFSRR